MSMSGAQAGEFDGPAPAAGSWASGFTIRDFLISAFFHIRVVILFGLIPVAVGVAAATLAKTEYTASSLLMVIVSREVTNQQNITDSGPAVLSIEGLKQVESEVQIIESADVIRTVIEEIGIDRLYPPGLLNRVRELLGNASPMDRAIARFRTDLRVSVRDGSNVIDVSFTLANRDLAVETADKLVQVYLARRRAIMQNPTARFLKLEVDRFKRELGEADSAVELLKSRAGIIDFTQDAVLAANQVDAVVQRRRQVAERRVAVASQIAEADRQLKGQPEKVFDFDQNADSAGGDDDNALLSRLLVERDRIALQYAPNGSMMREINRKIETVRQQIATRNQRAYQTTRDVRNPSIAYLSNMLLSLRIEADALGQQEKELADQQQVAEKRLAELRMAETELVELNRRRDTLNESYREYLRRATAAQIEEAAANERQSSVRLVQEAGAAVTSRNLRLPLLGAGVLGGILFGVAAGAVAAALRTSFIMPHEAERGLSLPMLGEYASRSRDDEGADERDLGGLAALLLDTEVDGVPLRRVQFLAAEPDEALVPLAAGVAAEITAQRGLRTLFVDLTAPAVDTTGGIGAREVGGLYVAPSDVPLLWVLRDRSRSRLLDIRLSGADARRMMDEIDATFEAVVICATARDADAAGHRFEELVDGNVLVLRAEKTRKAPALAQRESVIDHGGVPLGFVFIGRRYILPGWIYRLT
ncbi:lipopolysaccharide biosynthesis protein [Starkeya koreensis]|uniref:Lipopolysaccharide biosynthesis protein n=1 Tax=Ancylobacter koreensis TaxID=266121 RepID=A0ABT0DQ29_9HYPH|nr:lipopolysaccharide biosynthesis protein [Ancylobacter koreensis]MCK0209386.1 lipopolysaccharide biosynthesis protein [Ancylobacter koreensis]